MIFKFFEMHLYAMLILNGSHLKQYQVNDTIDVLNRLLSLFARTCWWHIKRRKHFHQRV